MLSGIWELSVYWLVMPYQARYWQGVSILMPVGGSGLITFKWEKPGVLLHVRQKAFRYYVRLIGNTCR